ncbi:hypothetical protein, partial [Paenibacillus polymyxa]|uniref:hypothetical protein n=1 Tax=Paenibacillus polymyxa TaxID=1406 RepID=UPI001C30A907
MDIDTLFSAFKENKWLSLVPVLAPIVVKVIVMLTASKIEKQLFKPKQRIYTKTLSLVLHSILATSIAY